MNRNTAVIIWATKTVLEIASTVATIIAAVLAISAANASRRAQAETVAFVDRATTEIKTVCGIAGVDDMEILDETGKK